MTTLAMLCDIRFVYTKVGFHWELSNARELRGMEYQERRKMGRLGEAKDGKELKKEIRRRIGWRLVS